MANLTFNIAHGQVIETSLVQALTIKKIKTLGVVLETSLVHALNRTKIKTVDQVLELSLVHGLPGHRNIGWSIKLRKPRLFTP